MPDLLIFGVIVALLILVAAIALTGLHTIPPQHQLVVFRLGILKSARQAGRTFLIPFLERGVLVDLRSQTNTIENLELLLRDRSFVRVNVAYTSQINDPVASVMNIAQPAETVRQLIVTTLQTLASSQSPADFSRQRAETENAVITRTSDTLANWGITLTQVSVKPL